MVVSVNQKDNYLTELSNGRTSVYSDTNHDGGRGGETGNFSPFELLEAGFASCLNITTRMVLDRMGLGYDSVTVRVGVDTGTEGKTLFTYHVDIKGDIDEATREKIIEKLERTPVRKALSREIGFERV